MAKDTIALKHSEKGEHPEGAAREHHGGHHGAHHGEGKTESPRSHDQHSKSTDSSKFDVKDIRVGIIAARWYGKEVHSLVEECSQELLSNGVAENNLHVFEVPGAFELPYAAARAVHCKDTNHRPDAVICIGCIVKDATPTYGTMTQAVANGIMKLNVTCDIPVIYGVLCCESESQAHTCSTERVTCCGSDKKCTYGASWAHSAIEMARVKRCTSAKKTEKCHCIRCTSRSDESGGKHESGNYDSCKRCGSSADKCACLDCNCLCCSSKRGECSSCGSSARNCSCKDCKCKVCSENRMACRSCGCPADKCSCKDCKCSSCCNKQTAGTKTHHDESTSGKMPHGDTAMKEEGGLSSSGAERGHSAGKDEGILSSGDAAREQFAGKDEGISSSGGAGKCSNCGSPNGKCMCGLLH